MERRTVLDRLSPPFSSASCAPANCNSYTRPWCNHLQTINKSLLLITFNSNLLIISKWAPLIDWESTPVRFLKSITLSFAFPGERLLYWHPVLHCIVVWDSAHSMELEQNLVTSSWVYMDCSKELRILWNFENKLKVNHFSVAKSWMEHEEGL